MENAKRQRELQLERWYARERERGKDAAQSDALETKARLRQTALSFPPDVLLLSAAVAGDASEIKALFAKHGTALDPNTSSTDGLTPLHQAAIDGRVDIIEILLQMGANVNVVDSEGWTPLHAAASGGDEAACRVLLDHGADLTLLNVDNETALDCAESEADLDPETKARIATVFKKYMEKRGISSADLDEMRTSERRSLLALAGKCIGSAGNDNDAVKELLGQRITPNGATILHIAACQGYSEVVDYLLEHGAPVDVADDAGVTPLHASVTWAHLDITVKLIKGGANPSIRTGRGESLMDLVDEEDHELKHAINMLLRDVERSKRSAHKEEEGSPPQSATGPRTFLSKRAAFGNSSGPLSFSVTDTDDDDDDDDDDDKGEDEDATMKPYAVDDGTNLLKFHHRGKGYMTSPPPPRRASAGDSTDGDDDCDHDPNTATTTIKASSSSNNVALSTGKHPSNNGPAPVAVDLVVSERHSPEELSASTNAATTRISNESADAALLPPSHGTASEQYRADLHGHDDVDDSPASPTVPLFLSGAVSPNLSPILRSPAKKQPIADGPSLTQQGEDEKTNDSTESPLITEQGHRHNETPQQSAVTATTTSNNKDAADCSEMDHQRRETDSHVMGEEEQEEGGTDCVKNGGGTIQDHRPLLGETAEGDGHPHHTADIARRESSVESYLEHLQHIRDASPPLRSRRRTNDFSEQGHLRGTTMDSPRRRKSSITRRTLDSRHELSFLDRLKDREELVKILPEKVTSPRMRRRETRSVSPYSPFNEESSAERTHSQSLQRNSRHAGHASQESNDGNLFEQDRASKRKSITRTQSAGTHSQNFFFGDQDHEHSFDDGSDDDDDDERELHCNSDVISSRSSLVVCEGGRDSSNKGEQRDGQDSLQRPATHSRREKRVASFRVGSADSDCDNAHSTVLSRHHFHHHPGHQTTDPHSVPLPGEVASPPATFSHRIHSCPSLQSHQQQLEATLPARGSGSPKTNRPTSAYDAPPLFAAIPEDDVLSSTHELGSKSTSTERLSRGSVADRDHDEGSRGLLGQPDEEDVEEIESSALVNMSIQSLHERERHLLDQQKQQATPDCEATDSARGLHDKGGPFTTATEVADEIIAPIKSIDSEICAGGKQREGGKDLKKLPADCSNNNNNSYSADGDPFSEDDNEDNEDISDADADTDLDATIVAKSRALALNQSQEKAVNSVTTQGTVPKTPAEADRDYKLLYSAARSELKAVVRAFAKYKAAVERKQREHANLVKYMMHLVAIEEAHADRIAKVVDSIGDEALTSLSKTELRDRIIALQIEREMLLGRVGGVDGDGSQKKMKKKTMLPPTPTSSAPGSPVQTTAPSSLEDAQSPEPETRPDAGVARTKRVLRRRSSDGGSGSGMTRRRLPSATLAEEMSRSRSQSVTSDCDQVYHLQPSTVSVRAPYSPSSAEGHGHDDLDDDLSQASMDANAGAEESDDSGDEDGGADSPLGNLSTAAHTGLTAAKERQQHRDHFSRMDPHRRTRPKVSERKKIIYHHKKVHGHEAHPAVSLYPNPLGSAPLPSSTVDVCESLLTKKKEGLVDDGRSSRASTDSEGDGVQEKHRSGSDTFPKNAAKGALQPHQRRNSVHTMSPETGKKQKDQRQQQQQQQQQHISRSRSGSAKKRAERNNPSPTKQTGSAATTSRPTTPKKASGLSRSASAKRSSSKKKNKKSPASPSVPSPRSSNRASPMSTEALGVVKTGDGSKAGPSRLAVSPTMTRRKSASSVHHHTATSGPPSPRHHKRPKSPRGGQKSTRGSTEVGETATVHLPRPLKATSSSSSLLAPRKGHVSRSKSPPAHTHSKYS